MRFHLLFAMLLISTFALGQFRITGSITENNKKSLGASVLLLRAGDSSLVKSALSNAEGIFRFDEVAGGSYILSITKIGTQAVLKRVNVVDKDVKADDIQLHAEAKSLTGV
ncbi:MAG TPA: carboxypeptidase-like regulatory domain-containing protein, partial [Flavisolibacter sp.]|nr:carboxypeptidase-like regulatory domain-containing protein [Flavisolibacter sp.]